MSIFDDLFEPEAQPEQQERPFDKDAWAEKKQAERQEVYELADKTTEEVSTDGDKYRNFLDVKSRLIHYSATNALLVLAQKPLATQLKDFNAWKKDGVSIRRGENHIKILEAGDSYERGDGSIGTSWNSHCFCESISQSSGCAMIFRMEAAKRHKYLFSACPPVRERPQLTVSAGWFPPWPRQAMGPTILLSSHSPSVIKPSQAMRAVGRDPAGGKTRGAGKPPAA